MAKFAIFLCMILQALVAGSRQNSIFPMVPVAKVTNILTSPVSSVQKLQNTVQEDITKTASIADNAIGLLNSPIQSTTNKNSQSGKLLLLPSITKGPMNMISSQVNDIKNLQGTVQQGLQGATSIVEDFTDQVTSTVESTLTQSMATIGNIIGQVSDGVKCLQFGLNLQTIAKNIASGMITCAEEILIKLLTKAKALVDVFGDFIIALNDIAVKSVSCSSNIETLLPCITTLWMPVASQTIMTMKELFAKSAALHIDFLITFPASLTGCGFTAASGSLTNYAQESIEETKKCVANL